jgi:hypothetical protein
MFEDVVVGQTEQLGAGHVTTLLTKGKWANLLLQMEERARARGLYEECAVGFAAAYGPEHPHTIQARQAAQRLAQAGVATAAAPAARATVTVRGLAQAPQHNGREAWVLGFDAARGRLSLELLEGGGRLAVRPRNVELAAAPAGCVVWTDKGRS